ncbi:type III secretion system chaperone [Brevifollis gellanilyticus]|uniref:Type III secretion system chaperone n=1 Tax=Brevifollis gellanilyticus TaxID=748831 RepID=A0A512MG17_9BACT|nr:type III secretion system chaperone [Brevifollis gellanilyticus]GEP45646.1 hypothetical protein BGE01nite_49370 [Brevifollis gellanilyticus]
MSTTPDDVKQIQEALTGLGGAIGIPELAWDEQGCCALQFDGLTVNLEHAGDEAQIYAMCRVGQAPGHEGDRLAAYQKLLEHNCFFRGTGGGVLGVDGPEGGIIFSHKIPAGGLDGERLTAFIEGYLNIAEKIHAELAPGGADAEGAARHEGHDPALMALRV